MKRFVLVGLLFFCLQGFAQTRPVAEEDLPVVVLDGFKLAYPDLPPRTWEQRNTRFVAIIRYEDRTEFATFLPTGEWAETRQDVNRTDLPESIISFIESRYDAYRIQSLQYVEENGGGNYYVVSLALRSNRNVTAELIFDIGGELLMIDGLPVEKNTEKSTLVRDDQTRRLRPGIQREVIDENKGVPEIVLTNLTRRYGNVQRINWTITEMGFHRGEFKFREENIATEWDDAGNQVSVVTFFNRRNAIHLIQKFLDENFPRARFISGERVVYEGRFTRMFPELGLRNYFMVEISDRPRGARTPTFFTIYFDASGQLDMIVERDPEESQ